MIFSASNDGIEWSLDFGPDSVTLTVNNLVPEMTMNSQGNPLAAWSLLMSKRQVFLNNHLARVAVAPNEEVTTEMRDQVLSCGCAQALDARAYQVSDLDDVEIYWENDRRDVTLSIDRALITPFHQSFSRLGDGRFSRNPHFARRRVGQEELSFSKNTRF